jgi:predicted ATP-binding protein involved in virulence
MIKGNSDLMKIKSLHIKNFRGFEDYTVSFAPVTTVVIGRNGAGKSTLLEAVKMALSFIFANNKSLGNEILSAGIPSLNISSFADTDYHDNAALGVTAADASISARGEYHGAALHWELYKRSTSNASLYSTKYKEAFRTFMHEWKEHQAQLPLIASFSDSFPHKPTKQTKFAMDSILKERIPRNFGYYQWDLETACTSIWETRLCNKLSFIAPLYTKTAKVSAALQALEATHTAQELANLPKYQDLKAAEEQMSNSISAPHAEIEFVQNRLVAFSQKLPKLSDERYDIDYLTNAATDLGVELNLVFQNGQSRLLRHLPAGYRRLYSIVLDLAYRAYILNGDVEPSGVVLIDEIDLHLHPSLEQEVVQCLHEVFPRLQFILSSHSASVISNLDTAAVYDADGVKTPANEILFMQEGQTQAEVLKGVYGLDYNSALRDFMDTPSRSVEIKCLGDEYLTYLSLGLAQEAQTVYTQLMDKLGSETHPFMTELKEKSQAYAVHR